MFDPEEHWNAIYGAHDEAALTWFEAVPELSQELITAYAAPESAIIDVGGGASRLPDALLAAGYRDLTVLDLAADALAISRARLGEAARQVKWVVGNITDWAPRRAYQLWHDRAVFHFLTEEEEQDAYLRVLEHSLEPGGHAIIGTFAEDGPERCSNLPVVRHSPESLAARIEEAQPEAFTPVEARRHLHLTPTGAEQRFQVSVFRKL